MVTAGLQLDLFGEVEAAETEQTAAQRARAERRAAFLRLVTLDPDGAPVLWTAPYDTQGGLLKGQTCPGWRCPGCGQIEAGEYVLSLNHAVMEHYRDTWDGSRGRCGRQILHRMQRLAELQRTAACNQRADGTCRTESGRGQHQAGGLITPQRGTDPDLHCPCECHSHNGCPDPMACERDIE